MIHLEEKKRKYALLPDRICTWYAAHKRTLPWRWERDPYKIWVSEIMLQQTRVEAVKPYYARFLKELPDVGSLAACTEDKLLKLWEGLGYYSRVRNMQKAARIIVSSAPGESHGEKSKASLPRDLNALLALPGIGSYTAGAIASIAYGIPAPAVDGNVLRILARVAADDTDILKASVKREAEQLLVGVLKNVNPGDFNQGMMDLGAGVCLPNAQPLCGQCPIADICEAHLQGRETELPVRKKVKERRVEQRTILLIRDGERVALTRRRESGLLAGLYEFPNLEGRLGRKAVLQAVEEQKLQALYIRKLEPAKHLFSHVEWQMTGYEIRVAGFPEQVTLGEGIPGEISAGPAAARQTAPWFLVSVDQIEREYPVPSAYKAYAKQLQMKLGPE